VAIVPGIAMQSPNIVPLLTQVACSRNVVGHKEKWGQFFTL